MPYSYPFFKQEIREHILNELNFIPNAKVLDVGAGAGTYADLIPELKMDALEIFPRYIEQFNLQEKYNTIHIGDIVNFDFRDYDYLILGDVLEHLTTDDALVVLGKMKHFNIKCVVAVPYLYEQGEYEGNIYETHHQPDLTPEVIRTRYPDLNFIYGDHQYGYYINYKPFEKPNLIISAGRRQKYFIKTITNFVSLNPDYLNWFNDVWVLDDRSPSHDRYQIDLMMQSLFPERSHLVTFNSNAHFAYVDKFNKIGELTGGSDFVFLLEDDWQSVKPLRLPEHIGFMQKNPHIEQIMFSQNFDMQWVHTQRATDLNAEYWKNPFPETYKHFHSLKDGFMCWTEVKMNNYGNNPSIYRSSIFQEDIRFINDHGWEMKFADSRKRTQLMTKEHYFIHIGEDSLVNEYAKNNPA